MIIVPAREVTNTYVATTYRQKCVGGNLDHSVYELESFPLPILAMSYSADMVKILEPVEVTVEGTNTLYDISVDAGLVIIKLKPNMVETGFIMVYEYPNDNPADPFKNIFYTIEDNDGTPVKKSVYEWFTMVDVTWLNGIKDYLTAD